MSDRRARGAGVAVFLPALLAILGLAALESKAPPEPSSEVADRRLDPLIAKIVGQRAADRRIAEALMGALLTLDDTQIRDRPLRRPCTFDASAGDGCVGTLNLTPPLLHGFATSLPAPHLPITNTPGEWASYVHFLPRRLGAGGRSPLAAQDSNLFMTAGIVYALFLIDDAALPPEQRVVRKMRDSAVATIARYKRNGAYSLWTERPGRTSPVAAVGPPNIPPAAIDALGHTRGNPDFDWLWEPLVEGLDVPPATWFRSLVNPNENPFGLDATFNIPNDADDTAAAVAIQELQSRKGDPFFRTGPSGFAVDRAALALTENFRDLGRVKDDGRDAWRGEDTGAYLTWLKDENLDVFASPETGVMPLAANNVDCVVNANIVFAKALIGQRSGPAFRPALALLARVIEERAWPECGLYYPQQVMFPYAVSRAVRDGGVSDPDLEAALGTLIGDLLVLQRTDGAFPGCADRSSDLSTALGAVALLNLGEERARRIGRLPAYRSAVAGAMEHLLRRMRPSPLRNFDTFNRERALVSPSDRGRTWTAGLFFASSYQDLGHWYSEAYTNAIVLEAVAKYLTAYDLGGVTIASGRRLHILRPTRDAGRARRLLGFTVADRPPV